MYRMLVLTLVVAALSGCSGRFAGFNNCAEDGSLVLFQYPNSQGSYDGLKNGPCRK